MKISESDFFAILRECAGIYARAARVISKKIGEPYSRQAVRERAEKRPDLMSDIEEENKDIAEEGLQSLMRSKNESIRMKSVFLYLKTKCRDRGYSERLELTGKNGSPIFESIKVEIVNGTADKGD